MHRIQTALATRPTCLPIELWARCFPSGLLFSSWDLRLLYVPTPQLFPNHYSTSLLTYQLLVGIVLKYLRYDFITSIGKNLTVAYLHFTIQRARARKPLITEALVQVQGRTAQ